MNQTNSAPDVETTAAAARLRQFIRWDIAANTGAFILMTILYLLFPAWYILLIGAEVIFNQFILVWALRQAERYQLERSIVAMCGSLWLILLSAAAIVPQVFPMLVLLIIWPVTLALPYLNSWGVGRLMFISTFVSLATSLLSTRHDPLNIEAIVPDWVLPLINATYIPVFTGLIFLLLWHYSRRLKDTLTATKTANAALLASERHLEARVLERTAQVEAQNLALRRSQEELAVARDAALEASQAKSAFLANMSHELRTPLNAIIGYSEMLQEEAEEKGQASFGPDLLKIHGAGKHLLSLINDILDLSKIEAGKMELYLETFDLQNLLNEVVLTVHPLIQKKANRLQVQTDPRLGLVHTDATKLRQALYNLLSNAAKFTEGGQITLRAERFSTEAGDRLRLSVSDSGIGMSQAQVGKLFGAFSQADASTTRKYGGTGLGLAITKRFCQMLGGDIEVKSQEGVGSTFSILLPAQIPETLLLSGRVEQEQPTGLTSDGLPLLLVIDDDPTTRDLIQRFMSKEGFRVEGALQGEEGLRLARQLHPTAIILDVMMPGMDGWAVLTGLKADPDLADIPVIMVTMIDDKNFGYALGASDYLTKPIERVRLATILTKYRPGHSYGAALVIEDDETTRHMLCRTLEKEGWAVSQADNGRVALEKVIANPPQLILLDLMMPEMDGFEFVDQLQKHPDLSLSKIPVVVITAKEISAQDRYRLNGYVERILQKGAYSREELLQEVRSLVQANLDATAPRAVARS